MFKATAEGPLEKRLWERVRSRGYGPWVSVMTSEKGSYRQADVLAFLDRHLPKVDEERSRRWRIIMADEGRALRFVLISDTHGMHRKLDMPDGDILVHAGDFTRFSRREDAEDCACIKILPHTNSR